MSRAAYQIWKIGVGLGSFPRLFAVPESYWFDYLRKKLMRAWHRHPGRAERSIGNR